MPPRRPDPPGTNGSRTGQQTASLSADSILGQSMVGSPPTVAAGATYDLYTGPVTGLSYNITIDATTQGTPTKPWYRIDLQWQDAANVEIGHETWFAMIGNISPGYNNVGIEGRGLVKGNNVIAHMTNIDTVPVTLDYGLFTSSRNVAHDDIRSSSLNITGSYSFGGFTFTPAFVKPASLIFGAQNQAVINASSSSAYIHGLYAGQMQLAGVIAGTSPNVEIDVYQIYPQLSPAYIQVDSIAVNAAGPIPLRNYTFGRMQSMINIKNLSATNSATVTYSLTAQEFT